MPMAGEQGAGCSGGFLADKFEVSVLAKICRKQAGIMVRESTSDPKLGGCPFLHVLVTNNNYTKMCTRNCILFEGLKLVPIGCMLEVCTDVCMEEHRTEPTFGPTLKPETPRRNTPRLQCL